MVNNISNKLLISLSTAVFIHSVNAEEVNFEKTHQRLLTVDSHVDIPMNYATKLINPAKETRLQVDIPKMKEGGLDAAFFIVFVDQSYRNEWEYRAVKKLTLEKFDAIHRMISMSSEINLANDVESAKNTIKQNSTVAFIGIENGFAIGRDLSLLEKYHKLGARYMTLVHNGHNDIGDSAQPQSRFGDKEIEHGGLSDFGKKVVIEMNRLGMMVDVSHVSKQTMIDATLLSKSPVIASHSSARALVNHSRNLDDDQLELIKKNGGVVQVTAVDEFLTSQSEAKWAEIDKIRAELGLTAEGMELVVSSSVYNTYLHRLKTEIDPKYKRATVEDLIEHVDYIVNKIGIDHVGLSSDFDGGGGILDWDNASETKNVTIELIRRGYTMTDIEKIWGGNLLRVLRANEKIANKL